MLVAHVCVSTEMMGELGNVGFTIQTFVLVGVDADVDAGVFVRFTLVFGGVDARVKKIWRKKMTL